MTKPGGKAPWNAQLQRTMLPVSRRRNKPEWLWKPDRSDRIKTHTPITVELEFWVDAGQRWTLVSNNDAWCTHHVRTLRRIVPQAQECMRDIAKGRAWAVRVRRIGESRD